MVVFQTFKLGWIEEIFYFNLFWFWEHNHVNSINQCKHIPDIVIDDYGDGRVSSAREQDKHAVIIPLPAPAIPLPAPQQNIREENQAGSALENENRSEVNESENDYTVHGN